MFYDPGPRLTADNGRIGAQQHCQYSDTDRMVNTVRPANRNRIRMVRIFHQTNKFYAIKILLESMFL